MNKILKQLREDRNITLKTVAKDLGITISCYSNYEQGLREPGVTMLIKIADYFDVSVDYLVGRKDY